MQVVKTVSQMQLYWLKIVRRWALVPVVNRITALEIAIKMAGDKAAGIGSSFRRVFLLMTA